MSFFIPSDDEVAEVIDDLPHLNEVRLRSALHEPQLSTGLDDWQFWTFICLARHIARQKWVAGVVETLLKGDPGNIGKMGSLGHPEEQETPGTVPDMPEWNYFFHGTGCNLTNETTGMDIDVDFTRAGATWDQATLHPQLEGLSGKLRRHTLAPEFGLHRAWHSWQGRFT